MSRLKPKQSAQPMTKILRVSGFDVRMICRPDIIMKQMTNTTMAPITGAGMIDSSALSFGDKPRRMNRAPAATPIHLLVAPDAPLKETLLDDVSDATPSVVDIQLSYDLGPQDFAVIDASRPLDEVVAACLQRIGQ